MNNVAIICPTFNAGNKWVEWIECVKVQGIPDEQILVIDSGSTDDTVRLARDAGFKVIEFPNHEFNHGQTRNFGADYMGDGNDYLVYLTQDALLASADSIKNILRLFQDDKIGAICGRQLPHKDARPIEAHARLFNYPEKTVTKQKTDIPKIGLKTAFMSNSFAAYRREAFIHCGYFPNDTIFAEDMSLAAKMIVAGWKVAYSAEALAHHSHSYTIEEEFKRYFDVGVFYSREKWIPEYFGAASGEGIRFVISELKYLAKTGNIHLIPSAIIRTGAKFIAFKLGGMESSLSPRIKSKLSMNKRYWK